MLRAIPLLDSQNQAPLTTSNQIRSDDGETYNHTMKKISLHILLVLVEQVTRAVTTAVSAQQQLYGAFTIYTNIENNTPILETPQT